VCQYSVITVHIVLRVFDKCFIINDANRHTLVGAERSFLIGSMKWMSLLAVKDALDAGFVRFP